MKENDFPRQSREMSASVSLVSSSISRLAAASGLASVESIEPEHAAHFPLNWFAISRRSDLLVARHRLPGPTKDILQSTKEISYRYVDTSSLRLNIDIVKPFGE